LPDFCGSCSNCTRISDSADLEARVAEAVAAREEMRDTGKRETRILIQTHPDVLIVPPDPPKTTQCTPCSFSHGPYSRSMPSMCSA
jgi:DNA polymerase-3 subunit delta'